MGSGRRSPLRAAIIGLSCAVALPAISQETAPHWTYLGEEGPDHWAELGETYTACAAGREQSPIDVPAATAAPVAGFEVAYGPTNATILNNGHAIVVGLEVGESITFNGDTYNALQFHFHSPSEHTLDGEHPPLEMHIVHANAAGALAVVGILFDLGNANPFLDPLIAGLAGVATDAHALGTVDLAGLVTADTPFVTYHGSLTTPPCTEGVSWFVSTDRLTISAEQLAAIHDVVGDNARPLQDLNGRTFVAP